MPRVLAWGGPGTGPGEMDAPLGIAVHGGSVWVADFHHPRIQRFTEDGSLMREWPLALVSGSPGFAGGLAVDAHGDVYVADFRGHTVTRYSAEGELLARWGSPGRAPGQFLGPAGIAVSGDGAVYVTDLDNRRVQQFTRDGSFVRAWGSPGREPGQFFDPWGIAVDARGDVYVADHGNHRVQKFGSDGGYLGAFGSPGGADAFLLGPVGVACAGDAVFVTDLANAMVQKFDRDGGFVTQWNDEADGGPAGSYYGVAVRDDRVFVADQAGHRVVRFLDETPARLPRDARPAVFAMSAAFPNPSRGSAAVSLAIPTASRLRARVFDVHGRQVRALADGRFEAGVHHLIWDGRDDGGAPAPAGVYFIRGALEGAARVAEARVAVVR